jgi:hypothetical protein
MSADVAVSCRPRENFAMSGSRIYDIDILCNPKNQAISLTKWISRVIDGRKNRSMVKKMLDRDLVEY